MKKPSGQLTILLILVLGLESGADYRAGDLEAMRGSSLTGAYLSGRRLIETPEKEGREWAIA